MWGMCRCGLRETSKPETKTGASEITVDADIRSPFRYRCVNWTGRMLLSDLLSRLPVGSRHKVNIVPNFQRVRGWLFSSQFDRGLPHRRYTDGFPKLLAVAGDDDDLAPAAAGRHIEQFLFHGVCRDDHSIYGFALASMGGDRISVGEFVIVRRERSSVFEANGTAV